MMALSPWDISGAFQQGRQDVIATDQAMANLAQAPVRQALLESQLQASQQDIVKGQLANQAAQLKADKEQELLKVRQKLAADMRERQQKQLAASQEMAQVAQAKAAPSAAQKLGSLADQQLYEAEQLHLLGYSEEAGKAEKAGAALLEKGSLISQHEGNSSLAEAKKQNELQKAVVMQLPMVYDQPSFDSFRARMQAAKGDPSFLQGLSYSPEVKKALLENTLTFKEQTELDIKEQERKLREEDTKNKILTRNLRTNIAEKKAQAYVEHQQRVGKAGGKPVTEPKDGEILAAGHILKEMVPGLLSDQDLIYGAKKSINYGVMRDVASRAKAIRQGNQAVSESESLARAVAEMQRDGMIEAGQEETASGLKKFFGGSTAKPAKYKPGGKPSQGLKPESALPVPVDGKYDEGRYYKNAQGKIAKRTKTGWEPVAGPVISDRIQAVAPPAQRVLPTEEEAAEEDEVQYGQ